MDSTKGRMIIASPTQTGDIPHIAAALALFPKTSLLLVCNTEIKDDDPLIAFYKQAAQGKGNTVIAYRPVPASNKRPRGPQPDAPSPEEQTRVSKWLYGELKTGKLYANWKYLERVDSLDWTQDKEYMAWYQEEKRMNLNGFAARLEGFSKYQPLTLTRTTYAIGNKFRDTPDRATLYATIAKAVASPRRTSSEIISDMDKWGLKTPFPFPKAPSDKPILLVWSRYTGQNSETGYNPAGDSDPRGQEQLIALGKKLGFSVVTIGHGPLPETRKSPKAEADCHLGEFYKNKIIDEAGRAGQMSFFLALLEMCPGKIIQIGQKTGGMDSAALLGMPTLYIEDEYSDTAFRMKSWIGRLQFYRRPPVGNPPTPLGRSLRDLAYAFKEAESQDVPVRIRVLAWVWILNNIPPNPTIKGYLKKLEDVTGSAGVPSISIRSSGWWLSNPALKEENLKVWLGGVQQLSPEALDAVGIQSGYSTGDLKLIEDELSQIQKDLTRPNSIVRNKAGNYVTLDKL